MKKFNIIYLITLIVFLTSCLNKAVDVLVVESACKDFKIYGAFSQRIIDPSCTGTPLTAIYKVTFNYDGEMKCLNKIVLDPKFYNASGSLINKVSYQQVMFISGDSLVNANATGKKITFTFKFTFANSTEANNFDNCQLKFHTENEQGNPSKTAEVKLEGECIQINNNNSTVVSTIQVNASQVTFTFWDDGSEDGDIITLYQGSTVLLSNYTLTKAGAAFTFTVPKGTTDFTLKANNQGSVGPNTCAIKVNGANQQSLSLDLNSGQTIQIIYQ